MLSLDIFGFRAMWSPYFIIFTLSIAIIYLLIVRGPLLERFKGSAPANLKQISLFLSGIIILYIIKGSPVDLLGHLMFSFHMTQMAVFYLVVPPLLLLGMPDWLTRSILDIKVVRLFFCFFTKPLIALILFNGLFSFYHMPVIFDAVKTDPILHSLFTSVLFIAAICMWWPLVCTLPEWDKLSDLQKLGYIFADGVLLTPACALIIFADTPLYTTYTDATAWAAALELCVPANMLANLNLSGPKMFSLLSPLDDQQLGGVIMKILQEIVYGCILAYVFFNWVKKERAKDELEAKQFYSQPQPNPNS